MTSRDFCYWLNGHLELTPDGSMLNGDQVKIIRRHLAMVFAHDIDPSMGDPAHQQKLSSIHQDPLPTNGGLSKDPLIRC